MVTNNLKHNEIYKIIYKYVLYRYLSYGRYIIYFNAPTAFLNGLLNENIPYIEDGENDEEEESKNVTDENYSYFSFKIFSTHCKFVIKLLF